MAGVVHLWNNWEVQILVLVSFVLQVFLLMFAGMRRRNISVIPRTLLWLAYLLADSIAVYILGHMSFSSNSHGKQQLMAFWAPFLLVHLGGQDNITAYSIEDNQLWPRHLLTFVVQTLGVAYVLYKHITGSWTLVTAAILIFVTGVLKFGERIWALKSSSLDNMSKFLEGKKLREVERQFEPYRPAAQELGPEEVLQGAHDLLPICMAQFVDYKFWPSPFQCEAVKLFQGKGHMYELIEMQLSLVHDFLYTKAAVVFTRYGCFIRVISSVATITAFFLFLASIAIDEFDTGDVIVTYILIVGAVLLEMISLLKAMGSTWACDFLRARRWDRLHNKVVSFRLHVKAAERNRRWSGSIDLPEPLHAIRRGIADCIREIAKWFGLEYESKDLFHRSSPVLSDGTKELVLGEVRRMVLECDGKYDTMRSYSGQCALSQCHGLFEDPTARIDFDDKIIAWYFATKMFLSLSSRAEATQQDNVVEAIKAISNYMVFLLFERPNMLPTPVRPESFANSEAAYAGLSDMKYLTEYVRRKGDQLDRTREALDKIKLSPNITMRIRGQIEQEKILEDMDRIRVELEELDSRRNGLDPNNIDRIRDAIELEIIWQEMERIKVVLRERDKRTGTLLRMSSEQKKWRELVRIWKHLHVGPSPAPGLARGAQIVEHLLYVEGRGQREVRRVVLGVWVEMLCYAAHHCSRDSHARQLNSGGEFITIVWLLSTAIFNHEYCGKDWFEAGVHEFFMSPTSSVDSSQVVSCCGISCRRHVHQRESEPWDVV